MKKEIRFFNALILTILYLVTIGSLLMQQGNDASVSAIIHKGAGILLLAGSLFHLGNHAEWLKAVFFQPAAGLNHKRQLQKRSMLFMLICLLICGISGVFTQAMPETNIFVTRLHSISGFMLILFMGIHLYRMRGWMIRELRLTRSSEQEDTLPVIYYKDAKES